MKIKSWSQLLNAAKHDYKKNSFILVPALVTVILSIIFQPFAGAQQVYPFFALLLVSVLAGVYIKAGMLEIVGKSSKGKASLKDCWKTANKKFFSLLGAEIIIGVIIGFIILSGIVAIRYNVFGSAIEIILIGTYGLLFATAALFLSFTSYAVVLSDKKAVAGLRESAKFVQRNFSSVIIFFIIMTALLTPVMLSVLWLQTGTLNSTLSTFLASMIMWLAMPYFLFLQGYFYLAKKK